MRHVQVVPPRSGKTRESARWTRRVERDARVAAANELLKTIASCGRRFFRSGKRVSRFEVDERGRVWFIDKWEGHRIYTHYPWAWRGFTEGGTLNSLVRNLAEWISREEPVRQHFGPWEQWYSDGDPWAYGADMQIVRDRAVELGIVAAPQPEQEPEG